MIWNYNNPFPYCIRGTSNRLIQEGLKKFCERYDINRCLLNFNSDDIYYKIVFPEHEGCFIEMTNEVDMSFIVDAFDFVHLYLCGTEKQWYDDLHIGDIVTIEDKGGYNQDYPYSFSEDMKAYSGGSFKIRGIKERFTNLEHYMYAKFFNGDFKMYQLEGGGDYYWHSSMFSAKNLPPIKKLDLTNISSFNPKFALY